MRDQPIASGADVNRFVALHGDKMHVSQAAGRRAAARVDRKDKADEGLTVDEIQQDEVTRQPLNLRARKRAAYRDKVRAATRLVKHRRRVQIAVRLSTPAPSRRQQILAARLVDELLDQQEAA